ncbi:MAG: hypothetical protein ACRDHB_04655 [Actinomycetota bacterium]
MVVLAACSGAGDGEETRRIDAPTVDGRIQLVRPVEERAGEVPTFEWRRVDGAAVYRLAVLNADGAVIWAWQGSETSVVLGGVEGRPEGETGPVLTRGSTWSVLAVDGQGRVVGVSEIRPVSP